MAFNLGSMFVKLTMKTSEFDKGKEKVEKSTKSMGASFRALGTVISVAFVAKAAKDMLMIADSLQVMERRLQVLSKTADEGTASFRRLSQIASETGVALEGVGNTFQRFKLLQDEIGASNKQLLDFTETLTKMGAVGGGSGTEIQNAMIQLSQGLAAGALRGEELNSILENMPIVAQAIAKEYGVGVGALKQMGADGRILSEDILAAILNQSEEINAQFTEMPKSMTQSFSTLSTEFSRFVGEVDQKTNASGFFKFLTQKTAEATGIWADALGADDAIQAWGVAELKLKSVSEELDETTEAIGRVEAAQAKLSLEGLGENIRGDIDEEQTRNNETLAKLYDKQNELVSRRLTLTLQQLKIQGDLREVDLEAIEAQEKLEAQEEARLALAEKYKGVNLPQYLQDVAAMGKAGAEAFEEYAEAQDKVRKLEEILASLAPKNEATWERAARLGEEGAEAFQKFALQQDRVREIAEKYKGVNLPQYIQDINEAQKEGLDLTEEQVKSLTELVEEYASFSATILGQWQGIFSDLGKMYEDDRKKALKEYSAQVNGREDLSKKQKEKLISDYDERTKKQADAEKALFIAEQAMILGKIVMYTALNMAKVAANPIAVGVVAATGAAAFVAAGAVGIGQYQSQFGSPESGQIMEQSQIQSRSAQQPATSNTTNVKVINNAGVDVKARDTGGGNLEIAIERAVELSQERVARDIQNNDGMVSKALNNGYNAARRIR